MHADYTKKIALLSHRFYKTSKKLSYLVIRQFVTTMTGGQTENFV